MFILLLKIISTLLAIKIRSLLDQHLIWNIFIKWGLLSLFRRSIKLSCWSWPLYHRFITDFSSDFWVGMGCKIKANCPHMGLGTTGIETTGPPWGFFLSSDSRSDPLKIVKVVSRVCVKTFFYNYVIKINFFYLLQ